MGLVNDESRKSFKTFQEGGQDCYWSIVFDRLQSFLKIVVTSRSFHCCGISVEVRT